MARMYKVPDILGTGYIYIANDNRKYIYMYVHLKFVLF